MQDSASFWTDIRNLENQLSKYPDSLCFARLSEVYLKVGLVDDALHTARQGVVKHPRYLSGQRALSLACHAKGLNDEALSALKLVTEALPEDIPSQKLLGRLSADAGARDDACQAFRTALEFAPDDIESRIELEALEWSAGMVPSALETDEDDEEVIEDLALLEEIEVLDDEQSEPEFRAQDASPTPGTMSVPPHDPLSTGTLAELYVKQGFIHKALEIYRAILADNPSDRITEERIAELEVLESTPAESGEEHDDSYLAETEEEPSFSMPAVVFMQKSGTVEFQAPADIPVLESQQSYADNSGYDSIPSPVVSQGDADDALAALDGWLENIRRIKACH
jgi:tetratricopeptide (TPR) repeat protein